MSEFVTFPAIIVICYLIGSLCRMSKSIKNKNIPVMVSFFGGILGVMGFYTVKGFPASDYLTATAVGIMSGLASTGVNQLLWQQSQSKKEDKK